MPNTPTRMSSPRRSTEDIARSRRETDESMSEIAMSPHSNVLMMHRLLEPVGLQVRASARAAAERVIWFGLWCRLLRVAGKSDEHCPRVCCSILPKRSPMMT